MLMNEFKELFRKTVVNGYPSMIAIDNKPIERQLYRHPVLDELSKDAFNNGKPIFYADMDPKSGTIKLSEPKYRYALTRDLSEQEFNSIFGNIKEKSDSDLPSETKFITTSDGDEVWHPCYPDNKIEISISISWFDHYYVKVAAWGADDFGVELVFENCSSKEHAEDIYNHYKTHIYDKIPDDVSLDWFYEHGFVNF